MLRRFLIALLLSPLLAACAQSKAPDTTEAAATATPAPVEAAPAPAASIAAPVVPAPVDVAGAPTVASAGATPAAAPAPAAPTGPEPREGVDYVVLDAPQPTWGQGKIEVAEVFGYPCIHCHHLQPLVNEWHKTLPADVRFEYVPAAFGGPWDTYAEAFFAAELLKVREKTHDAVFNRIHEQNQRPSTEEDVAAMYGELGVDSAKFLAAMQSFGVDAKLAKARQFATRAGVTGTPTIIVAGKYRVMSSSDRGFPGMLSTVDHLVARERAAQAGGAP
jgi:thiol:disulfide interchange protein DsbA